MHNIVASRNIKYDYQDAKERYIKRMKNISRDVDIKVRKNNKNVF